MKHLTTRGRKKAVGKLLLKVFLRYAQQRQKDCPEKLDKEPQVSLHKRPPTSNKRGGHQWKKPQ